VKLNKRPAALVATALAGAMMLSACGGSDDSGSDASGGGSFSVFIGEPQNPLLPGNTNESEGAQVLDSLFTGLVRYDKETSEAVFTGVAESIESPDATVWTVKLKDGWTFHDGSPVNAQSFVDAWNYAAYSPNAQANSSFFDDIAGWGDLQAPTDADGNVTGDPAAEEMSGLRVVDDLTFEVTLSTPYAQWPTTVGYTAFFPLPSAFFDDPEGFGEQPIGNGPFQAEDAFVPGAGGGITLTRYEDYAGDEPASAESVEYRIYTEVDTAYTDLQGGSLDVIDTLPPDAIASAESELGDRYLETTYGDITSLSFPVYDERFADPRVRRAISMAIDRQAIADAIFQGTRTPATSFISPVVTGHRDDACDACELNVDEANRLLDEAGFDRSQPVDLWFNAGAGHDAWMEAIGNQLRENVGVDFVLKGDLQQAQLLPLRRQQGMTGPWRDGWIMDYPTPENFLAGLYSTAAIGGGNYTFYSNPEFDSLLQQGNAAASEDQAIALYQQAEDILVRDMPAAPLFYRVNQGAHSENVDNVTIDAFGRVDAAAVTVVS
jgi:oligopeptide transport system substrate-binding protein